MKPANVLLRAETPGGPGISVVLTDFGVASLGGSTQLTATGDLIGSPEYIAPERIRGTDEGPAADLWSLGLVLYVAVEGVSPLRRASTLATLAAVLDEPVPPPVRSGPLAPVLGALLVRDPALRPDAERLDAMLAAVANGIAWQPTETADRPPVPAEWPAVTVWQPSPAAGPRSRTPVIVAVIAVALALVAGAALVLALRGGDGTGGGEGKGGGSTAAGTPSKESPEPTKEPTKKPTKEPTKASKSPTRSESPDPATPPASSPGVPPASGSWIAQLFSEPVGSGADTRDRRLTAVRKDVPEAEYLRSDDYASLRPGFWVIYAPGPFAEGRAALRFCAERGRTTGNECVGRYLSSSGGDYGLQCKPPASAPVGRCTRA